MNFGVRKLESWAIMRRYLRDPTFSRFDTIPECDRHTHTRALKFSTYGVYIKSCQRDDKSLLKGAWFCSRDPFCMGNCGLRKILHCTAEARAVSCDTQFAANRLLLIASTALILGLRSIGWTCHRMCCKVGCITYRINIYCQVAAQLCCATAC